MGGTMAEADQPQQPPTPRDAIIFISGIGSTYADQRLEGISSRIAMALDLEAATGRAKFQATIKETPAAEGQPRVCTISKVLGDERQPIIDVYTLDYAESLTAPYRDASLLTRWRLALIMLVLNIPDLLDALVPKRRPGKDKKHK